MKVKVPFFHNGKMLYLNLDTNTEAYQDLLIIDSMTSTHSDLSDTIDDNCLEETSEMVKDFYRVLDKLDTCINDAKNWYCTKYTDLISEAEALEM